MKITVSSLHVVNLGVIRLLVKISILIDMNQFVVVHQINQHSATYVKKNIPSFQIAKTYKFILTKNLSQ